MKKHKQIKSERLTNKFKVKLQRGCRNQLSNEIWEHVWNKLRHAFIEEFEFGIIQIVRKQIKDNDK